MLFSMWLLHWLPLPVLGRVGNLFGTLVYRLASARRKVTLTNLRLCFPQWTAARREAVARAHFQAYTRSFLERGILWWASERRLRRLIEVDPPLPRQLVAAGPTILLCPHFVSLDVAGLAVTMATPGCSIYSRQSSAVLDAALRHGRTRFNPVALFARAQGIKPVIRAMRQGLPFFMCPDMDFGARDALFVPFFGVPAATLTAPARIARLTGAKVVPVVARMLPGYRGWKVSFLPAWENYPDDDLATAARRMNAFIETQVLQAPAEYFWAHRRFKTRPSGTPDLYAEAAAPASSLVGVDP
jgi:KDO2-lipid IV(A) lauroyltransferase